MSKFTKVEDEEDFLEVDPNIPGQNYCCLSFVSPEKLLKQRDIFYFSEFMKDLIKTKQTDETKNLREKNDLADLIKKGELDYDSFKEAYDNFLYANEAGISKQFDEDNDFQTSVRGVKVRGTYDSLREAQKRAKILQRRDKNFHVFVGQVGYWLPWDPDADGVENQEYQESHLNKLVKKYNENKEERDEIYDKNKRDALDRAEQENKKMKEKIENERKLVEVVEGGADDADGASGGASDGADGADGGASGADSASTGADTDGKVDTKDDVNQKLDDFRNILNKKDGHYEEMMEGNRVDPWLHHKLGKNEDINLSSGITVDGVANSTPVNDSVEKTL